MYTRERFKPIFPLFLTWLVRKLKCAIPMVDFVRPPPVLLARLRPCFRNNGIYLTAHNSWSFLRLLKVKEVEFLHTVNFGLQFLTYFLHLRDQRRKVLKNLTAVLAVLCYTQRVPIETC
jgi:23S rRNA G2069 N7-methylase RlmK/C1962 C5-methylase RlmI